MEATASSEAGSALQTAGHSLGRAAAAGHPTPRPHVQSSCRCLAKKKIPEGAERNAVRRLLKTVQWQEHLEYSTASLT